MTLEQVILYVVAAVLIAVALWRRSGGLRARTVRGNVVVGDNRGTVTQSYTEAGPGTGTPPAPVDSVWALDRDRRRADRGSAMRLRRVLAQMSPRGLRNWFGRFRARDIRGNLVIGGNTGLIYQVYGGGPPPAPPTIPWAPSLPGPDAPFATFNLLSWKFRLVPGLIGREAEAARLHDWALTGPALRIRFLTGPGGAGKTRLAAEVASALPGWHAGFVPLHTETPLPWSDRGVLIILDYPEAWPEQVRTLLREAATAGAPRAPVRILLLSRSPMSHWEDEIGRCKAEALCDTQDVGIGALAPMAAAEVFRQAVARLASDRAQPAPPFDAAVLDAWLARNPKLHGLPLLTTAAAIHFMNEPGPTLGLEAAEIVAALVRRERTRLDDAGRAHGLGARGAARVVGLAALRDGLDAPALRRLAAPELEMELPEPARLLTTVRDLGWWQTDRLPAPEPDIVAAELLRQELAAAGDRGGARVWAVLGEAGAVRIELLDRRLHDMVTLYGPGGDAILRDGLVAAVAGRGDRAQAWRVFFNTDARSFRLAPVGIAVGQALLTEPGLPDPERAEVLNNLSVHLSDAGNGEARWRQAARQRTSAAGSRGKTRHASLPISRRASTPCRTASAMPDMTWTHWRRSARRWRSAAGWRGQPGALCPRSRRRVSTTCRTA